MIQPVSLLSSFADHAFITCQDVYIFLPQQVLAEKLPEHLRPGFGCIVKALDGPVTASIFSPACKSQHCHPPGHGEHRQDYPAHLPQSCFG